jgi:DNA-binding MarR family transcriptional regulator
MSITVRTPVNPFIGSLCRLVWQWVRHEIHDAVLAAGYDDLNPAHVALFRNPGPEGLRPSELADEMQITKQSVNELLGYLERHGYIVRAPDPTDSRSRLIRLTDVGLDLQAVIWRAAEAAEGKATAVIGDDRMRDLRTSLVDLVTRLDPATDPPPP